MCAFRPLVMALAAAFGAAAALAAAVAPAVCDDTMTFTLPDERLIGHLIGEENVVIATFPAVWWPGYPVVTAGTATGWYALPDGLVIAVRCSFLRPGLD